MPEHMDPFYEESTCKLFTELLRQSSARPAWERVPTPSCVKAHRGALMSRMHLATLATKPHRPGVCPACDALATGSAVRSVNESPESRWLDLWVDEKGRCQNDESETAPYL